MGFFSRELATRTHNSSHHFKVQIGGQLVLHAEEDDVYYQGHEKV